MKFHQLKKKKSPAPQPPSRQVSTAESKVSKSKVRTSVNEPPVSPTSTKSEIEAMNVRYAPEWVTSAQEEIHTLIAQRHFEEALTLITKCEEYFAKDNSFHNATDTIQKVNTQSFFFNIRIIIIILPPSFR